MRVTFQALFALLGLSSMYVGLANFYFGAEVLQQYFQLNLNELSIENKHIIDVQIRILSGVWIAAGIFALLAVKHFEMHTSLLRLIFLGFAASALGEWYSLFVQTGDITSGLNKAVIQVGLCMSMEIWRYYLVRKPVEV